MIAQKLREKKALGVHVRIEGDMAIGDDLVLIGARRGCFNQPYVVVADVDPDGDAFAEIDDRPKAFQPAGRLGNGVALKGRHIRGGTLAADL